MLLACVGLYGTLSYLVNTHRKEVGLRLALGAMPGQIAGRFLARGVGVSVLGSIAGLGLSLTSTRLLAGMLYGVSTWDPLTLGGVLLLMFAVAMLASLLPSVRAARAAPDPIQGTSSRIVPKISDAFGIEVAKDVHGGLDNATTFIRMGDNL